MKEKGKGGRKRRRRNGRTGKWGQVTKKKMVLKLETKKAITKALGQGNDSNTAARQPPAPGSVNTDDVSAFCAPR